MQASAGDCTSEDVRFRPISPVSRTIILPVQSEETWK
jgi:hypothetical protein